MNKLDVAREYRSIGLSIIPVGKDKKPIADWKEYQTRYATDDELVEWFYSNDYNIAIVTGQISKITVVDVENSGDINDYQNTLSVKTPGGGYHFYFNYNQDISNKVRIKPLTDIRNNGGYVLAPPSATGIGSYEWINSNTFNRELLKDFPLELFDIKQNNKKQKLDFNEVNNEGCRNENTTSFVGTLLAKYKPEDWDRVCLPIIRGYNNENNKPPLDDTELMNIYKSISSLELQNSYEKEDKIEVCKPERETNLEEWRNIIRANFPECLFPAEVAASILAQLLIKDVKNPFALVLVDVPSAGKTITINFFSGIEGLTYSTDKFSAASFVSNAANISKEKLNEVDLLPRIKNKMLLVRDLAPLFGEREDDLTKSMGMLTRVLDGEGFETDSGVHGKRGYVGDYNFMLLAGSTPIRPKTWKTMGNLGSRLFFLNMNSRSKSEDELVNQLIGKSCREKEMICREATKNLICTIWSNYSDGIVWNSKNDDVELIKIISRNANLLANLRGTINVWKEKGELNNEEYSHTVPVIEQPDRINQLLYNVARGHAIISGRNLLNKEDLKLVIELAIDSAPPIRAKLFRKLLEYKGKMNTSEVENELKCSKPTALKEMETLKILDIVDIVEFSGEDKMIKLKDKFSWFLSNECNEMRGLNNTGEAMKGVVDRLSKSDAVSRAFNNQLIERGRF